MAKAFKVPELGDDVESGIVVSIMVAVGDTITVDQPILELETDKAVLEVPSSVSGVIEEIQVKNGDEIGPGQVILTVAESNGAEPEPEAAQPESAPAEASEASAEPEPASEAETQAEEAPAEPSSAVVEFKLPELGDSVESGTVVKILVAVGDSITVDQSLLELETDKAVLEVPSDIDGVVREIMIAEGDQAGPGQAVMKVEAANSTVAASPAPTPTASKKEESAQPEPEKPKTEAKTDSAKTEAAPATAQATTNVAAGMGEKLHDFAPAAPSTRILAREIGVDINYVPGSGPGGRISKDDVKVYSRQLQAQTAQRQAAPAATAAANVAQQPLPDFSQWGEIEREAMSGIRRATARNLSYSWSTIPHVTQHDKADVTDLEKFREKYARKAERAGAKITPNIFLIKLMAEALKVFPKFNSSIDMDSMEIIYKKYINIAVAVDTPHGLLVPVIRDADQKSLIDISLELMDLADKARNRKLTMEQMAGGSMTLTALGHIGGTSFTPIVKPPEVAILGVCRYQTEPIFIDGKFEPRTMLPLSLSYDHRVIDGADGARFTRWICDTLESPFNLFV